MRTRFNGYLIFSSLLILTAIIACGKKASPTPRDEVLRKTAEKASKKTRGQVQEPQEKEPVKAQKMGDKEIDKPVEEIKDNQILSGQ